MLPLLAAVAVAGVSCSASKQKPKAESAAVTAVSPSALGVAVSAAIPKALLYKTSGRYLNNVPVQMTADGNLISFPAPTDIPSDATPLQLADGWLLSRVGVGPRSVFTRWTFDEYRALPQTPAPQEIIKAVIPGSAVTAILRLPMTFSEALADTAAVNRFILANPR